MIRRLLLLFSVAATLAIPPRIAAQGWLEPAAAPAPGRWSPAVDSARAHVHRRMVDQQIPGLSVAVVVDGRTVWSEGFGFADLENGVAVTPLTRFRIASISKALTAAAVGRLVEEGRLDLDAPVQRYVPSFPEKRWPLTTRELAGHVAGVRHYRGDEFASTTRYADVVDALEIFADDTLLFEPGTAYSYSTYGWNLVSAVVQGASDTPFLTWMRDNVLEPLRLDHTVAEHPDSVIRGRARFYVRGRGGRLLNAPYVDNSNKWAGGGYLSTAEDMARYGASYLSGGILAPSTVDLLWTSQRTNDGEPTGYGIGWRVADTDGRRVVWHTGGAMGGSTVLMILPDAGISVAILANVQGARHVETARAVAEAFALAAVR